MKTSFNINSSKRSILPGQENHPDSIRQWTRNALAAITQNEDIARYALGEPSLSSTDVKNCTTKKHCVESWHAISESSLGHGQGWFAIRTCRDGFIREKITQENANPIYTSPEFWSGVCSGYRTGIRLGEIKYIRHALLCLREHSRRITRQLELSEAGGKFIDMMKSHGFKTYDSLTLEENIRDMMVQCYGHNVFNEPRFQWIESNITNNPLEAFIFLAHAEGFKQLGLGDLIIYSESKGGYWNENLRWIEEKHSATPVSYTRNKLGQLAEEFLKPVFDPAIPLIFAIVLNHGPPSP